MEAVRMYTTNFGEDSAQSAVRERDPPHEQIQIEFPDAVPHLFH